MPALTFTLTGTRNTTQIHFNRDFVGLLFKETDYTGLDHDLYVIHLHSDPRGRKIVRSRSLLNEMIQDRIATHPNLQARPSPAKAPTYDHAPF